MAVAKNSGDSGTPNANSGASAVQSLDVTTYTVGTGSNLLLVACLYVQGTITGTSCTWDNGGGSPQAMTSAKLVDAGNGHIEVFYLIAPHTGNLTLHAAWTNAKVAMLGLISFTGADQTNGLSAADSNSNSGTAPGTAPTTGAITSTTDGATVGNVFLDGNTIDSTSDQTQVFLDNATGNSAGMSYALGGTSNTHDWATVHSGNWTTIGVHVLASSGVVPTLMGQCLT